MKISVLIVKDAKQIMLTPENEHEGAALKMIAPGDKIDAVTKWGDFYHGEQSMFGLSVDKCRGGYYRGYPSEESLIFLVTSGEKK